MPLGLGTKIGIIIFGIIFGVIPGLIIVLAFAFVGFQMSDLTIGIAYVFGVLIIIGAIYGKEKDKMDLIDAIKESKEG
jgi:hypothetical protein